MTQQQGYQVRQLKIIGPIEANNLASYNFEYFWHTDIVVTAKIIQIKIQFMNGATKVIANPISLVIDDEFKKLL